MPGLVVSSEQSSNPARPSKQGRQSEWTFNFRAGFESDSSGEEHDEERSAIASHPSSGKFSAEDGDSAAAPSSSEGINSRSTGNMEEIIKADEETEDARLLRELDIASRADKDPAKFTTTPWSIARVNAAIRDPPPLPHSGPSCKPNRTANLETEAKRDHASTGPRKQGTMLLPGKPVADARSTAHARKAGSVPTKLEKSIGEYFAPRKPGSVVPKKPPAHQRIYPTSHSAPRQSLLTSTASNSQHTHVSLSPSLLSSSATTLKPKWPSPPRQPPSMPQSIGVPSPRTDPVPISHESNSTDLPDDLSTLLDSGESKPTLLMNAWEEDSKENIPLQSHGRPTSQQTFPRRHLDCAHGNNPNYKSELYYDSPGNVFLVFSLRDETFLMRALTVKGSFSSQERFVDRGSGFSRPQFSSPLRNEVKMEAPTDVNGCDYLSGTVSGFPEAVERPAPQENRTQFSGQPKHSGYMPSFSSPIKPTSQLVQPSGRAALGLDPPRALALRGDEHLLQPKSSQSPGYALGSTWSGVSYRQHCSTAIPLPRSQQDASRIARYPKKEEDELVLPAVESRSSPVQAKPSPPSVSLYSLPVAKSFSSPIRPPKRELSRYPLPTKHCRSPTTREPNVSYDDPDDDDASWSTLPQRKKSRSQGCDIRSPGTGKKSIKQSGRFKLPIALPSLPAKVTQSVVSHEPTSAGKKRVITYLPPPPSKETNSASSARSNSPTIQRDKVSSRNQTPLKQTLERPADATRTKGSAARGEDTKVMRPVSEWSLKRFSFGSMHTSVSSPNDREASHPAQMRGADATKAEETESDDYMRALSSQTREVHPSRETNPSHDQFGHLASDETDTQTLVDPSSLSPDREPKLEELEHGEGYDDSSVSLPFDLPNIETAYPTVRKVLLEVRSFHPSQFTVHYIHPTHSSAKQLPPPSGTSSGCPAVAFPSTTQKFPLPRTLLAVQGSMRSPSSCGREYPESSNTASSETKDAP